MSTFFDEKLYGEKLQKIGFVKTGGLTRIVKTMDEITTNDSIMIEEKWTTDMIFKMKNKIKAF